MNTTRGVIRYFNAAGGFGFVRAYGAGRGDAANDVFFHARDVQGIPEPALKGAEVACEWEQTPRGPRAVRVWPEVEQ